MWSNIVLLPLLVLSTAYPTSEIAVQLDDDKTNSNVDVIEELNNELLNAVYKQNFKNTLTQYVTAEYKDLTFAERDKVEDIIEDLLQTIVSDFTVILSNEQLATEDVSKRIGDPTFEELHKRVVLTVPNISEHKALRLAYRLQNNLIHARQRLDKVIKDSKLAYIQNSY